MTTISAPYSHPQSISKEDGWHLDRKVTISMILALLMNAAGSIWWAASLNSMVTEHNHRLDRLDNAVVTLNAQQVNLGQDLARIQESLKYQTEMLKELREDMKARQR